MNGNGFTRFKVDLQSVFFLHRADTIDQDICAVIGECDVVTAAEIEPFHFRKELAEFIFYRRKGTLQRFCALFAHGVKMQTADAVQLVFLEVVKGNPQP